MKKSICCLLVACMMPTFFPAGACAQLLLNKADLSEISVLPTAAPAIQTASNPTSQGSFSENVTDDYVLGAGDIIEAHLIVGDNALALDYSFIISPEGKIFFPNIGETYLNGLTVKQAKFQINRLIKKKYQEGFALSLFLKQPKKIKVYMTGLIVRPGPVEVWDASRVSEVIKQAGSVLPGGSNRTAIIKREGKALTADLYLAMEKGDITKDIRVTEGDIVLIPVSGSVRVTVMGEVPRPGQYELKDGEKLKEALAMAGYAGVNSALSRVAYLKRERGKEEFENYKLNLYDMFLKADESQNIELSDGDIISIPSIQAYIYIYGEVGKPGRIEYQPGKKLSDYINLVGGPTVKANLAGVTVTRQENDKPKVYRINASEILHQGNLKNDIDLFGGDVVFVPGNFFYFSDFASFASTILLAFTLYSTVVK